MVIYYTDEASSVSPPVGVLREPITATWWSTAADTARAVLVLMGRDEDKDSILPAVPPVVEPPTHNKLRVQQSNRVPYLVEALHRCKKDALL